MASEIKIHTQIVGLEQVLAQNEKRKAEVRERVKRALLSVGEEIERAAEANAPQGRKGRLKGGFYTRELERPDAVSVRVRPAKRAWFAHIVEGGVKAGEAKVKPHTRRVRSRDIRASVLNEKTGKTRRRIIAQGLVFVQPKRPRRLKGWEGRRYFKRAREPWTVERVQAVVTRAANAALASAAYDTPGA